ncbi:hypothetical protein BDV38DRAFT_213037 [Aspergillus pseudotamarii]|uniref:Uncharacterized protein n=1 Tax=Aspergillus pseudotamarii TaxID=132259 RepID=A0A5N6SCN6_ASPPS|nr:uncharacterized protein BDV38DRAFT_213037 [Aspergillus pseudotamarii]KAE8132355.1 hypothetical protein BDV38DRAFT_213037 [Aspergillus pseudotamarii]
MSIMTKKAITNDADNAPRLAEATQAKTEGYRGGDWCNRLSVGFAVYRFIHSADRRVELRSKHAEKPRRNHFYPPYLEVNLLAIASYFAFLVSFFFCVSPG